MLKQQIQITVEPATEGYILTFTNNNAVQPIPRTVKHIATSMADVVTKVGTFLTPLDTPTTN